MPPKRKREPAVVPTVDTPHPYTTVYTDGSSTGKVGPGGWAWAIEGGAEASGGHPETTNNRMEMQAAFEAVRAIPGLVLVVSDSSYVVNAFNEGWWKGWRRRGWANAAGDPVANRDLWEPFVDYVLSRNGEIRFAWVKGHAGLPGNERVDQLAKAAKDAVMQAVPAGPIA